LLPTARERGMRRGWDWGSDEMTLWLCSLEMGLMRRIVRRRRLGRALLLILVRRGSMDGLRGLRTSCGRSCKADGKERLMYLITNFAFRWYLGQKKNADECIYT